MTEGPELPRRQRVAELNTIGRDMTEKQLNKKVESIIKSAYDKMELGIYHRGGIHIEKEDFATMRHFILRGIRKIAPIEFVECNHQKKCMFWRYSS